MKGKRNLLIGIVLGVLMGWALGYLRLPFITKNYSFLIGFGACLALVAFLLALLFVWNKNSFLVRMIGKKPTDSPANPVAKTYASIWILVSLFIVLGGAVSSYMIYQQNELFKTQTQDQNQRIEEQSELIESIRKGNQVLLMSNVLDKVDEEIKNEPDGLLSDATIARVAALSYSFKPYRYYEGNHLSEKELSPERGQLLLALSIMELDSISFAKIKQTTSFASADLRRADLRGADLSGVDLQGADLKDAQLAEIDLNRANLYKADLWGANLNKANLDSTNLKRAELSWAEVNGADLRRANLNGANLTNAKLRNSDFREAIFQWAESGGAMFNNANFEGADLYGSVFKKANFTDVNLTEANLLGVQWPEANLSGAAMEKVSVDGFQWLETMNEWRVTGVKDIEATYKIVDDTTKRYLYARHRLERINGGE